MSKVRGLDIAAYVPRWLRTLAGSRGAGPPRASAIPRHAAVLLLDIAGFTEITDRLAQQTEFGAERLSDLLNDCFSVLTDIVESFGGDITAFTGDGFLAVWDGLDFGHPTLAAAQCALALQSAMEARAQSSDPPIRLRISVDAGTVYYCALGGHDGVWRHAVVGTPFENVGAAYNVGSIGEVALCEAAWREVSGSCEGERVGGIFRLTGLKGTVSPISFPQRNVADGDAVQLLVPRVVIERLQISSSKWLAEIRTVSVLCIKFHDVTFVDRLVDALQPCILAVQRVSSKLEGDIFGFWMDDKGVCIALVFGAPPRAHEEDPLRALEAGLAILDELQPTPIGASIGIGSGRLFCGDYGGRSRREYGVLGPAINTAARLMEVADGGILCDLATAEAVQGRVSFAVQRPRRVKGRPAPLQTYRPIGMMVRSQASSSSEMIGRDTERRALQGKLDQRQDGAGGLVLVQGEPGIGKSRLLTDFVAHALTRGIPVVRGYASAIDWSTPYFAWRQVLAALVGDDEGARAEEIVAGKLQNDPTLMSWAPLLRDVLPLALSPTPLTERITGAARAASIEALFVALLRSARAPSVLVLEDLHWFDEASLHLLKGLLRRAPENSHRRKSAPAGIQTSPKPRPNSRRRFRLTSLGFPSRQSRKSSSGGCVSTRSWGRSLPSSIFGPAAILSTARNSSRRYATRAPSPWSAERCTSMARCWIRGTWRCRPASKQPSSRASTHCAPKSNCC